MFFNFILEKVAEDNKEAVQKILQESFAKQAEGTFSHEYLMKTQAALLKMIKPEAAEELKAAMTHIASQMQ